MAPPSLFPEEEPSSPQLLPPSLPANGSRHPTTLTSHDDDLAAVPVIQRLLPRGVEGACLLGGRESGKSSLAFELCYKFAQREPDRQAIFIHRHDDARTVAKTARFVVVPSSTTQQQQQQQQQEYQQQDQEDNSSSWDFSVLENVFLKRFTTAQHLCWYFGSLHQQPDHLLPSVIVVDDLDQFRGEGHGLDAVTVNCQVLSVMHDAAQHIRRRTGRPCWLVVTMEHADRGLLAPLTRQLGRVLRIVRQGTSSFHGNSMYETVWTVQEDNECTHLLGKPFGSGGAQVCRFSLDRPKMLQVLEEE